MSVVKRLIAKAQERANECGNPFVVARHDKGDELGFSIWPMDEVDGDEWEAFDAEVIAEVHPAPHPEYAVLDDIKIRVCWACPECDESTEWPVWEYQYSGTPMCIECDCDMQYIETRQYQ